MRLARFLLSRGTPRLYAAVLMSLISGLAGAWLLRVLHLALTTRIHGELGLQFAVGAGASFTLGVISQLMLLKETNRAVYQLRQDAAERVIAAPLPVIEELGVPQLLVTLTDDVNTLVAAIPGLLLLLPQLAILLGCFAYMLHLSPQLFACTLLCLAAGLTLYYLPVRRGNRAFQKVRATLQRVMQHVRALTEGIKELKVHPGQRRFFLDHMLGSAGRQLAAHVDRAQGSYVIAGNVGQSLYLLSMGGFVFIAPGWLGVPLEVAVGFVMATLYLAKPIEFLIAWLPNMARAKVALDNLERLGMLLPAESAGTALDAQYRSIELRDVTYHYPSPGDEGFHLGPVNLTLEPGQIVFIVGGNGGGKTTLGKLLCGLYSPSSGVVLRDGRVLDAQDLDAQRALFSPVFSDSFLFERILDPGADVDARANQLLTQLKLAGSVRVQDGVFSSTALSLGQRKRLLLLGALLEDRPIYLLDEWAAEQDPELRELYYHGLLPALRRRGKTVVAVSHDDRYFHVADRVLKLERGHIVELAAPPQPMAAATPTWTTHATTAAR